MIVQTALQSEAVVKLLTRSDHLPRLFDEVAMRRFETKPASIDATFPKFAIECLELLHEGLHHSLSPATTSQRPFPVDLDTLGRKEEHEVRHLTKHFALSALVFCQDLWSMFVVQVNLVAVESASRAEPCL